MSISAHTLTISLSARNLTSVFELKRCSKRTSTYNQAKRKLRSLSTQTSCRLQVFIKICTFIYVTSTNICEGMRGICTHEFLTFCSSVFLYIIFSQLIHFYYLSLDVFLRKKSRWHAIRLDWFFRKKICL